MNGVERERGAMRTLLGLVSLGIILLLLLWVATLWVSGLLGNEPAEGVGDIVLLSLLVMPILIYAIISGSLKELRGPGGVGASFNSEVAEPVSKKLSSVRVSIDDESKHIVSSGETQPLQQVTQLSDHQTQPIFMDVTFGKGDYTLEALRDQVESHYLFRSFELVVFLTRDGYFLAFMPAWAAKQTLNDPAKGQEFVDLINRGNTELLLSWPGVVSKSISTEATNAEALREMVKYNSRVLVVTDGKSRVAGIAEREQVIGRMMLALTDSSLQRG
jgi:hypothetical protein